MGHRLEMLKLIGLALFPVSLAMKLIRLPMTVASCIAKLGCLLLVFGVPAVTVVLYIYLT